MAIRTIEKKFDDFDGKPLPEDHKPWRFQVQSRAYDLYLSSDNRKKVDAFLKNLTKGAVQIEQRTSSGSGRSPAELGKIREWLRSNGHNLKPTGRISKDLIAKYDAAH